jgi:peptidoglycan hydrolase FlgJ
MLVNPSLSMSDNRQSLSTAGASGMRGGSGLSADSAFTDLNSLQSIRQLGKADQSAALMQVARQFESMFLNMMLTSMRKANEVFSEDSLFNSPESSFYEGMLDNQMALGMAGQGDGASSGKGMGLADIIHRQLMSQYGVKAATSDDAELSASATDRIDQNKLYDRRVASLPLRKAMAEVDEVLAHNGKRGPVGAVIPDSGSGITAAALQDTSPGRAATVSGSVRGVSLRSEADRSHTPGQVFSGGKGQQFASAEAFVAALYPHAEKVGAELGVDPRAIVAQAALETGWGKHMIEDSNGRNSFNFFGIKADQRWQGDSVTVTTHEVRNGVTLKEKAAFRAYDSLDEGLRDYASFLQSSRYQDAIGQGLDADQYGFALQKAGYATDPRYGEKIRQIARGELLNQALPINSETPLANPFNSADKE